MSNTPSGAVPFDPLAGGIEGLTEEEVDRFLESIGKGTDPDPHDVIAE